MSFKTEAELRQAMSSALSGSSLYTMEETVTMLQNHIENVVYGAYSPEVYGDTFEFLDAWETQSQGAGAEMHYEPDYLSIAAPVHASVVTGAGVASVLADWIFQGNSGGLFGNGGWNSSRDAWKALDKEMTNSKFRSMYESGMTAVGIPWKRSGGAVIKTKD